MTTTRDVIAECFAGNEEEMMYQQAYANADRILAALLSAPDPARQELAALLNPWWPVGGQDMSRVERSNEKYQRSKMKYDNDGYPDLPKEPTVTIPRVQHEALMAAAQALEFIAGLEPGSRGAHGKFLQARQCSKEALAALEATLSGKEKR